MHRRLQLILSDFVLLNVLNSEVFRIKANALLLFTNKIIPPPCAQGLDSMLKACVICDDNSDTCHKDTKK